MLDKSWKHPELNPGPLGAKRNAIHCAMRPPPLGQKPGTTFVEIINCRNLKKTISEKPETGLELSLPVCNTAEQYAKYRKFIKIWDGSGEKDFYRLTGCTPPCRQRRYKLSHLFTSNFDCVKYYGNSSDDATIEVTRNIC